MGGRSMPAEGTPDRHTEVAANRTAEAAERTRETAVRTTVAAQRTEASADRRTELAANRTVLAAERTYAAWVHTGLVVLTGSVLVAFAAFCFIAASGASCPRARRRPSPTYANYRGYCCSR